MKPRAVSILAGVLVLNLALTSFLLLTRERGAAVTEEGPTTGASERSETRTMRRELASLRSELRDLQETLTGAPAIPPEGTGGTDENQGRDTDRAVLSLAERLTTMESSIRRIESAMDGISLEAASAERAMVFAGDDGNLRADEYFEAGKFAIAGEGYLAFLESHPDHPDHRSILERARNAFTKAGYDDKAIWAQNELMRIYPETRSQDLRTLAAIEKGAGHFAEAAQHATEAASLNHTSGRYWDLLYAAWYTELADGPQAGLDYYRNVQQQIIDAGFGDQKLGRHAQERIEELERRIAASR